MAHMGVQRYATNRNQQAEILVDFALQKWTDALCDAGYIIASPEPVRQEHFERDDCSDIFDHYLVLDLATPVGDFRAGTQLQIWGQTTTYKGNARGQPEPNKTYEIRETLVEALGLRRWLRAEGQRFRTLHFTVGSEDYTYSWFKSAKKNAFDVSLYPDSAINMEQVFGRLLTLFDGVSFEYEYYERLEGEVESPGSEIGQLIVNFKDRLYEWFTGGAPACPVGDLQADLLTSLRQAQAEAVTRAIRASHNPGANIKKRANKLLTEGEMSKSDPAMVQTLKKLLSNNPFLRVALEAEENWPAWAWGHLAVPAEIDSLSEYVSYLWCSGAETRLVARRLLLRIHTEESVHYIQDTGIPGLTEHNLYGGDHGRTQVQAVTSQIVSDLRRAGITSPQQLYAKLASRQGQQLLTAARIFEAKNGTNIRPSFDYITEALSGDFIVTPMSRVTGAPKPVAYHDEFGMATVKPYQNLKAVLRRNNRRLLAILKAKSFRGPEFARRVKEEAYVGITTKFTYESNSAGTIGEPGHFRERYVGIPLIMFVDMEEDLDPPTYAVRRLVTAGWQAFFSVDSLISYLKELEGEKQ